MLGKLEEGLLAQTRVTSCYQGHSAGQVWNIVQRIKGHAFEEAEHGKYLQEQRLQSTRDVRRVGWSPVEVN